MSKSNFLMSNKCPYVQVKERRRTPKEREGTKNFIFRSGRQWRVGKREESFCRPEIGGGGGGKKKVETECQGRQPEEVVFI